MNIKKIYEAGKKGLVGIALASALTTGCDNRIKPITRQETPYFVVENVEALWSIDHRERPMHIENGITYTPIVRFDTLSPQLEGIKAQQGDEIYIFRSGMYDSRLTEIQNTKGEAYLRVGRLPEKFQSFEGVVGEDVDASFTRFIKELSK